MWPSEIHTTSGIQTLIFLCVFILFVDVICFNIDSKTWRGQSISSHADFRKMYALKLWEGRKWEMWMVKKIKLQDQKTGITISVLFI